MSDNLLGRFAALDYSTDGGVSWKSLRGIVDVGSRQSIDQTETSDHDSGGHREFLPNFDNATLTAKLRWKERDASLVDFIAATQNKTRVNIRLIPRRLPGTYRLDALAGVSGFNPDFNLEDTAMLSLDLQLSTATWVVQ